MSCIKGKDNRNYPVMPMSCLPNLCLVNKVRFIDQFCCSWSGWSCCFSSLHLKMNHENLLLQLVNLFICYSQYISWHCNFLCQLGTHQVYGLTYAYHKANKIIWLLKYIQDVRRNISIYVTWYKDGFFRLVNNQSCHQID